MRQVIVGIAQIGLQETPAENLGRIRSTGDSLTERLDVLCFPGLSLTSMHRASLSEIQGYLGCVGNVARHLGAYVIVGGYAVRDGRAFNEVYVLDRGGDLVHTHQKRMISPYETREHLGDAYMEISPGTAAEPCDADFGRIGVAECLDVFSSSLFKDLAGKGAQIFFNIACWPWNSSLDSGTQAEYNFWPRDRSRETGSPLVFCDTHIDVPEYRTVGRSRIFFPDGTTSRVAVGDEVLIETVHL